MCEKEVTAYKGKEGVDEEERAGCLKEIAFVITRNRSTELREQVKEYKVNIMYMVKEKKRKTASG